MGKRQRHQDFIPLTDEQIRAIIRDPSTPSALRRKAVEEEKFRKLRNKRMRRNR